MDDKYLRFLPKMSGYLITGYNMKIYCVPYKKTNRHILFQDLINQPQWELEQQSR